MSVYATILDLSDDDHADGCARLVPVGGRVWEVDPDRPCTCRAGPLTYTGSHILPADDDARGGGLDLGAIPGHITRDGRDDGTADEDGWWPFLRVAVHAGAADAVVVLTRAQVDVLRAALDGWWARSDPTEPAV